MSWTPTDEQVEKHARVGYDFDEQVRVEFGHQAEPSPFESLPQWAQDTHREKARAQLVAVGPHIAASVLRDAAATQDEESARIREAYRQHNAARDPNRPPRRPDLNTWSNADEATAHRLRARADQIEKEAGR